jgi:hypothetical protein
MTYYIDLVLNVVFFSVSILCKTNISEDLDRNWSSQKAAIDKAYNLMSQMLLDNDSIHSEKDIICDVQTGTKRLRHDSTESPQMRTPGKKREKQNKRTAKADMLNIKDRESDAETLYYGDTLASESVPIIDRDVCPELRKEIVPETFCSQYPAHLEKSVPQCSVIDLNERIDNIQTTPKKQMLQEQITQKSSPILGGSNRKSTHKTGHCDYSMTTVGSPDNSAVILQTVVLNGKSDNCINTSGCEDNVDKSPSLLKIQSGISNSVATGAYKMKDNSQDRKRNEKLEQNVSQPLEGYRECNSIQADFWKLKPMPNVSISNRNPVDAMNCKLKQTTLSLHCFSKKQDLCTLKEFNGGVRPGVFETSSLVGQINGNCDEETSLKLAIQESLNEKENMEYVLSENKYPEVRSWKIGFAEDDDDCLLASPNLSGSWTLKRQKRVHARGRSSVSR